MNFSNKKRSIPKKSAYAALIVFMYSIPSVGFAAIKNYQLLAPIKPFLGDSIAVDNLSEYLNVIYKTGIAVCTGLAVIMIVMGGLRYVSSAAIGGKGDGKTMIQDALWGLLLALTSYLLLNTINPALLKSDLKITATPNVGSINPTQSEILQGDLNQSTSENSSAGENSRTAGTRGANTGRPGEIQTAGNVTYFGTNSDIRVIKDPTTGAYYALSRSSEGRPPEGSFDPNRVDTKYGSNWYYALDASGKKIEYPQGSVNGAGGYTERTAISGQYFKDITPDTVGFAAPSTSAQAEALGLPFINSNSALRGKTLQVKTSSGRTLTFPVVEKSGAPVGTWEFTYGGAKQLNGETIVPGSGVYK
jgi:hypothetical protein